MAYLLIFCTLYFLIWKYLNYSQHSFLALIMAFLVALVLNIPIKYLIVNGHLTFQVKDSVLKETKIYSITPATVVSEGIFILGFGQSAGETYYTAYKDDELGSYSLLLIPAGESLIFEDVTKGDDARVVYWRSLEVCTQTRQSSVFLKILYPFGLCTPYPFGAQSEKVVKIHVPPGTINRDLSL